MVVTCGAISIFIGWCINNRLFAEKKNRDERAYLGAPWPTVVILVLQANLWSIVQYEQSGTYLPRSMPLILA